MQKKNSKCFKRLFYSIILKCRYYILKKNLLEAVLSILVCPLPGITYFLSVAPDDWTNGHCPVLPAAHMTPCHQLLRKLWQSPAEGGGVCGNQQDPGLESGAGRGLQTLRPPEGQHRALRSPLASLGVWTGTGAWHLSSYYYLQSCNVPSQSGPSH